LCKISHFTIIDGKNCTVSKEALVEERRDMVQSIGPRTAGTLDTGQELRLD
jgi:hypothetical protein